MKKTIAFFTASCISMTAFSQNNYYPTTGNVGLGTTSSASNFNLQLHGTTNYFENDKNGNNINYGFTSRIGLTNTTTGFTATDGLTMRMSQNDFSMNNRENGNLTFQTGSLYLNYSGSLGRAVMGTGNYTGTEFGLMNYYSADNGIFIRTTNAGRYGLSIRPHTLIDVAMQVMSADGITKSFSVLGNGNTEIVTTSTTANDKLFVIKSSTGSKLLQVTGDGILRSREIIVDLGTWADYVFKPEYKLMSMDSLQEHIQSYGHLPNIPNSEDMINSGMNVSETSVLLLEKVEELTLYILQLKEKNEQLEERLKILEASK